MQRLSSFFPSGAPGTGLLLLRAAAAAALVAGVGTAVGLPAQPALMAIAIGMAVGLCAGVWTPVLCLLAAVAHGVLLVTGGGPGDAFRHALDVIQVVALALLGPGAYSVDARRYGRRVVVLPK